MPLSLQHVCIERLYMGKLMCELRKAVRVCRR